MEFRERCFHDPNLRRAVGNHKRFFPALFPSLGRISSVPPECARPRAQHSQEWKVGGDFDRRGNSRPCCARGRAHSAAVAGFGGTDKMRPPASGGAHVAREYSEGKPVATIE